MDVNDNACFLNKRATLESIVSKLPPTEMLYSCSAQWPQKTGPTTVPRRSMPMTQEARFSRMEPELRKANLIEATLVCLKRHGFQGASIRKISAEAGVSVGLISHHYSGKDELVAEAYRAVT